MCDLLGVDVHGLSMLRRSNRSALAPAILDMDSMGIVFPSVRTISLPRPGTQSLNFQARFIGLAAEINGMMLNVVATRLGDGLNRFAKSIRGAKILVLGVACAKMAAIAALR